MNLQNIIRNSVRVQLFNTGIIMFVFNFTVTILHFRENSLNSDDKRFRKQVKEALCIDRSPSHPLSRLFPSNPGQTITQGGSIISEFQIFHKTTHHLGDLSTNTFNLTETSRFRNRVIVFTDPYTIEVTS
jgi:hypothetical protein